jgi:Raf kinase inhibitor-like YbhB/YbcL family protein
MYDPDAPTGSGFWHWLVFDIPASTTSIAKGAGAVGMHPGGGMQAYSDAGIDGYVGPCPPAGDPPHHYVLTLYAVKAADLTMQGISAASTGAFVGFVLPSVAIAKAELRATYGR